MMIYAAGSCDPVVFYERKKAVIAYYLLYTISMQKLEQYQDKTDEELVVLTLKNQDCFLYLMRRYEKKLSRYIMRISNVDKDEAEDILQETFIRTYQNLNDFDTSLKFSSWIYRITRNQAISNYRKTKTRPQQTALDADNLRHLASDLDIVRETDSKYLKDNIYHILNKMEMKYREVLILKFLEEKEYKEISDILKKPMGTIATLINRAKKQFKEKLKEGDSKIYD